MCSFARKDLYSHSLDVRISCRLLNSKSYLIASQLLVASKLAGGWVIRIIALAALAYCCNWGEPQRAHHMRSTVKSVFLLDCLLACQLSHAFSGLLASVVHTVMAQYMELLQNSYIYYSLYTECCLSLLLISHHCTLRLSILKSCIKIYYLIKSHELAIFWQKCQ